jgi:hypothetical protein
VGTITGKHIVRSSDGDSDFNVAYWFVLPNGQRIEAERGVSKRLWNTYQKGGTLEVAYSASNPRRNFPLGGGVTSLGVALFVSVICLALAMFGTLFLFGNVRQLTARRVVTRMPQKK